MAEEGNGSNGFIIIAILVRIIVVSSINIANISAIVTKILYWILGITISIIVLLVVFIILRYVKKKTRFSTSLTLGIRNESVSPNQDNQSERFRIKVLTPKKANLEISRNILKEEEDSQKTNKKQVVKKKSKTEKVNT